MTFKHGPRSNDVAECAALYALGCLAPSERSKYAAHLESCVECQAEVEAYTLALSRFALSGTSERPPADARQRFLAKMRETGHQEKDVPTSRAEILLKRPGLLITRPVNAPWQPSAIPGLFTKTVFVDEERKYATALVRMDAGGRYPSHRHADVEEVYLLAGDLHIEGQTMRAGDYCRAEAESIHEESFTEQGCLFLLMSSQMDEILS